MRSKKTRRPIIGLICLALFAVVMTAFTPSASAGPGGSSVYNAGQVGIGIVVNWPGYDYVLPVGWTSTSNSRGGYTGAGWCTNTYHDSPYDRVGFLYDWTVRGPAEWSLNIWAWERFQVYSYRC